MFKRKLIALDHPAPDSLNVNDENSVRNLILWLEDRKIRHYKIEEREPFRTSSSAEWVSLFNKYCKDLACPVSNGGVNERIEWLLSYAVSLEYGDDVEKYKGQNSGNISKILQNVPKVESTNPLDNMDFQSEDFKKGVSALAQILNITQHPDHILTLQAVCKVVTQRLNPQVLDNPQNILALAKGEPFPFEEADLGFDVGGESLNLASKILRLLYINDLRSLQTLINETIVSVQSITSNPKTDTKLGQVGR